MFDFAPTLNCLRKAWLARHQAFQVRALIADVLCCRWKTRHARLVQLIHLTLLSGALPALRFVRRSAGATFSVEVPESICQLG